MATDQAEVDITTAPDAGLVLFRFSMSMAVNRIAVPPPVVFVRAYAGETEAEALARSGHRTGETQFIHLA